MASLKDVRLKITGVGKTKQITKAMNMVAAAKLRGAQNNMERFRPYAEKFREILEGLAAKADASSHPLLAPREAVRTSAIIVVTADRGLCGSFNVNIINAAVKLARAKAAEGKKVVFHCVGRKGRDSVRKTDFELASAMVGQMGSIDFTLAANLGRELIEDYLAGKFDEALYVYSHFASMARQEPTTLRLLPIGLAEGAADSGPEYIYEPDAAKLMAEILPRHISVQIYNGLLDTNTGEHAARMTAMDNATRNCDDLVRSLTMLFNKTRQASITRDLMDIVGGAEALNG